MDIAIRVAAAGRVGEDRAAAYQQQDECLLVLADGAGGTSGGGEAADIVVASARDFWSDSVQDCVRLLQRLDQQLTSVGQTTAIVAVLSNGQIWGASVGDSAAWLIAASGVVKLTRSQRRKPLLGSGAAVAVGFGPVPCTGRLLIASDGLFNYVKDDRICDLASSLPPEDAATALVAAARLPSGGLQDDIAVIVGG